ncbi:MAG: hypothetical protein GX166_04940, partial [Clostridiaceae bacterium]|nr:hypothetical protein [Clostridiaceae bacterium]
MSKNTGMSASKDTAKANGGTLKRKSYFRRLLEAREFSLIIILIVIIALTIFTDTFASNANLTVMLQGMTVDMII